MQMCETRTAHLCIFQKEPRMGVQCYCFSRGQLEAGRIKAVNAGEVAAKAGVHV